MGAEEPNKKQGKDVNEIAVRVVEVNNGGKIVLNFQIIIGLMSILFQLFDHR